MTKCIDVALLASRSGHNAEYIVKSSKSKRFPFNVCVVICNGAGACTEHFKNQGLDTVAIDDKDFPDRRAFEGKLMDILSHYGNPLAVSCSFNRLLSAEFLVAYPSYVINSHPSILPAFPGRPNNLKPVDAAIAYGATLLGATVHFIDAGMDTGSIIIQGALARHRADEDLLQSILHLEAIIKIQTLCWFAEERISLSPNSREVKITPYPTGLNAFSIETYDAIVSPALDKAVLSNCLNFIIGK